MSQSSTRRNFLKLSGTLATAVAPAALLPSSAQAAVSVKITSLKELKPLDPVSFNYPGSAAAVLIDMGAPALHGVGPRKSVVAFSSLCQHMGCPAQFDARSKLLVCGCHGSEYDPGSDGRVIEGPSTRGLPRIRLNVASDGTIPATGVVNGVVYGRANNDA